VCRFRQTLWAFFASVMAQNSSFFGNLPGQIEMIVDGASSVRKRSIFVESAVASKLSNSSCLALQILTHLLFRVWRLLFTRMN
jgi:hypothetical protein